MTNRTWDASLRVCACLCLAAPVTLPPAVVHAQAQAQPTVRVNGVRNNDAGSDSLPAKPSIPPSIRIPAEPLGFSPPGAIYLGQHSQLISLDFLDEDHLLFTFRAPGLQRRENKPDDNPDKDERHMRAVVLALPAGTVQAETIWTLHDWNRYLSMLKDGRFLLRDGAEVLEGDATLQLKPILRFPGPVVALETDPGQHYIVTNSREPLATEPRPGDVPSPATAAASVTTTAQPPGGQPQYVVRILRRDTGKVMLVSRVRLPAHVAINDRGYLESIRGKGTEWLLNLNIFGGGSAEVGKVKSMCSPSFDFVSKQEVLVSTCVPTGGRRLVALTVDGHRLWEAPSEETQIWPKLAVGPDGSRVARETVIVTHPVSATDPIGAQDVKGQLVQVFDLANGKVVLTAQPSPVLDAGGNVAISPSGHRVAVLMAGAIQIFELPPAPALPVTTGAAAP